MAKNNKNIFELNYHNLYITTLFLLLLVFIHTSNLDIIN